MKTYIDQNIKYLLHREKWDHATFAAQFDVSRAMVSHYVLGKNTPKIETLAKIADHFNMTIDDLVRIELSKKPQVQENDELYSKEVHSLQKPSKANVFSIRISDLEKTIKVQDRLILSLEQQLGDTGNLAI